MKLLKFEGLMIYKEKVVYTDNNRKKKKKIMNKIGQGQKAWGLEIV